MTTTVKTIPDGYHAVTPLLVIKDAARAMEFYRQAFGAKEVMRFEAPGGGLMHAEIDIGGSRIMLGDESAETGCLSPISLHGTPVGLYLYVEDVDAVFNRAVEAGAKVKMPVADMFWGDRMGQLTDPFGHLWSVATHKEDLTPEQVRERGEEFIKGWKPTA